jgi:hypothetical protein
MVFLLPRVSVILISAYNRLVQSANKDYPFERVTGIVISK